MLTRVVIAAVALAAVPFQLSGLPDPDTIERARSRAAFYKEIVDKMEQPDDVGVLESSGVFGGTEKYAVMSKAKAEAMMEARRDLDRQAENPSNVVAMFKSKSRGRLSVITREDAERLWREAEGTTSTLQDSHGLRVAGSFAAHQK